MATVGAIVGRSLRLIGVQDPDEPIEAADFQTCVEALNAMCTRWEANGNPFGWSNVENPSDEMPSPAEMDQAIAANLAVIVAPEFDATVPESVARMAVDGYAAFLRDCMVAAPIEQILNVPTPSGIGGGAYRLDWPGFPT